MRKIILILLIAVFSHVSFLVWPHFIKADNSSVAPQVALGENISVEKMPEDRQSTPEVVPGELIVKFKNKLKTNSKGVVTPRDTGVSSIDSKNKSKKVASIDAAFVEGENNSQINSNAGEKGFDRVYKMKFSTNEDEKSLIDSYKKDPNVEYIQPNYILQPTIVPNDTSYGNLWDMTKINVPGAWDITHDSSAVIVAVVDTGTNYLHEDLAANIWNNPGETGTTQAGDRCWTGTPQDKKTNACDDDNNGYTDDWHGWNYIDGNNDPMDMGFQGTYHGSHVSGTISAVGNNNKGIVGVNWNAKIMPLRICDTSTGCYTSYAASAIRYAADNGAKVINNSWGGQYVQDPVVKDAIDYAHSKGVVVVNAAGNNAQDVYSFSPANIGNCIAVSATDSNDARPYFSNWGSKIDVGAPGVNIYSAYNGNSYEWLSGTSMAAPHVAGLAALIFAHDPTLNNEEVRQIIKSSADDIGATGWDSYFGSGRINAYNAITASRPPIAYISSPTTAGLILNGTVPIIGTASGATFQSYKIEYGLGTVPSSWTQVVNSSTPVQDGTLGNLNLQQLQSGSYVLRLTVTDTQSKQYQFQSYFDTLTNPTVPTSFTFTNLSTSINLSWVAGSAQFPIAGYQIYKSESSDFSNSTILTTSNTYYTDSTVQTGHIYYYKLRSYDNQSTPSYSDFTNTLKVINGNPWWIHQVSTKTSGGQKGNGNTVIVSAPSSDGRYIAFSDNANDLVAGDYNGKEDIFFKDITTNITTRISVSTQGVEGNCESTYPVMSSDGRYVAFQSCATNLVANDTNGKDDIFVRDTQLNTTSIVSTDTGGSQSSTWTGGQFPAISPDGRYVTFTAFENDTKNNVYRKDLQTGITQLVSATATGTKGNYESFASNMSGDGRYVVFDTSATNFVSGAIGGTYFKDMQTNAVENISIGNNDAGLLIGFEVAPSISDSGRYVVFQSSSNNILPGQTTNRDNLFLRDRQNATTQLITTAYTGGDYNGYDAYGGKISSDGRYITFYSTGSDLVAGDTNNHSDVFLFDRNTSKMNIVSVDLFGSQSFSTNVLRPASFSYGGKFISFPSYAQGLIPSVPNPGILANAYIRTTDGSPGPLENIAISPSSDQTIPIGQVLEFSAQGKDEYDTDIPNLTYIWSGADQNGMFDGSSIGKFSVKASNNGKDSATVTVTVSPESLDHIDISPSATQDITAGQTISFTAQGKDQYGNDIPGLTYTWTGADSLGTFNNASIGEHLVKASIGGINSSTVTVNVAPAELDHINISPASTQNITAGDSLQFHAQGKDQFGNDISSLSYVWGGTDQDGFFNSSMVGSFVVFVSSGSIQSPIINVNVNPGPLDHVEILPGFDFDLSAGDELQFIGQGKDQLENIIAGLTYSWSGTDQDGNFKETIAGTYPVKVSSGGKESKTINVSISPSGIDHVEISPNTTQTIQAGQTIQFGAIDKDIYGNEITGPSYDWSGTDANGLFTASSAGNYAVKVNSEGFDSQTINVTVNPGSLNRINISPNTEQLIPVGQTFQFSAQGQDQYGNDIVGLDYDWTGADSTGLFSNLVVGAYQVSASSGGVDSAIITVQTFDETPPGAPSGIVVE